MAHQVGPFIIHNYACNYASIFLTVMNCRYILKMVIDNELALLVLSVYVCKTAQEAIDIENRNPVIRNGFLIKSPYKYSEYEFDNEHSNLVNSK